MAHSSVKGLCIDVCEVGPLGELLLPAGALMHTRGVRAASSPRGPAWLVGSKEEDRASLFYLRSPSVMICETRRSPGFTEGPPPHIFVVVVQGT